MSLSPCSLDEIAVATKATAFLFRQACHSPASLLAQWARERHEISHFGICINYILFFVQIQQAKPLPGKEGAKAVGDALKAGFIMHNERFPVNV